MTKQKCAGNSVWEFQKATFVNGLLEIPIKSHSMNFELAKATREELQTWVLCEDVLVKEYATECLAELEVDIWPYDRMEVIHGFALNRQGVMESITDQEASVFFDDQISLEITDL